MERVLLVHTKIPRRRLAIKFYKKNQNRKISCQTILKACTSSRNSLCSEALNQEFQNTTDVLIPSFCSMIHSVQVQNSVTVFSPQCSTGTEFQDRRQERSKMSLYFLKSFCGKLTLQHLVAQFGPSWTMTIREALVAFLLLCQHAQIRAGQGGR